MRDLFNNAYFNTANETAENEKKFIEKAKNQNEVILKVFKDNPDSTFSASQIEKQSSILITSIRRALSTLETFGQIVHVGEMKSPHGRNEFIYKLK